MISSCCANDRREQ